MDPFVVSEIDGAEATITGALAMAAVVTAVATSVAAAAMATVSATTTFFLPLAGLLNLHRGCIWSISDAVAGMLSCER